MHQGAQTVFPSREGGFPPATFFLQADAMTYACRVQALDGRHGVGMCHPRNFIPPRPGRQR